jgi:hypothetical protein
LKIDAIAVIVTGVVGKVVVVYGGELREYMTIFPVASVIVFEPL